MPNFSRAAVYYLWSKKNSLRWKTDTDEFISSKELLNSLREEEEDVVQQIPLRNEDGYKALAFSLPAVLKKWGSQLREISVDSACT